MILATVLSVLLAASAPAAAPSHWNGGRNVPVHRLAPLDEDGDAVSPADSRARPVSTVKTCGQCHDLSAMKGGTHFRTGLETNEAPVTARTEPWFWIDPATGTQMPLSLHGQPGAWSPREVGLSCWEWTKLFGRHFPGGGVGSDSRCVAERADDRQRWFVTGPLEPNCFACHSHDPDYDSSEWARQVMRENFRGAATAALGLADVQGMNSRLDAAWDPARGPNLDDHVFVVPEQAVYDRSKFDAKGRTVFHVGKPTNERCLACHSASERGMDSHDIAGDVHLRAGMKCIDCHTSGMDHRMTIRTCAGCHLGTDGKKPAGPRPVHAGFPAIHFQKLACTVCHSGVTRGGALAQIRTSRANRIGVYGRAQWATEAPFILEPVFLRNRDGVIEPCRVAWPACFMCPAKGDNILEPYRIDRVRALTAGVLDVQERAAAAQDQPGAALDDFTVRNAKVLAAHPDASITTNMIHRALERLGSAACYVAGGHVFFTSNGVFCVKADSPVTAWPVAHDVRPAREALGAEPERCAACHTADSGFFFGKIAATGPVADLPGVEFDRAQLLGIAAPYHRLFGFTFLMRPFFKLFLWSVFALVCLFAAAAAAAALPKACGRSAARFVRVSLDLLLCASAAYLGFSGGLGWIFDGMTSWWLVLHMVAGGAFAFALVLLAVFRWADWFGRTPAVALAALLFLVFSGCVLFTAVMPMMSVFGTAGQEFLLVAHRYAALGFLLAALAFCFVLRRSRK